MQELSRQAMRKQLFHWFLEQATSLSTPTVALVSFGHVAQVVFDYR
jgi:hypothetical protein